MSYFNQYRKDMQKSKRKLELYWLVKHVSVFCDVDVQNLVYSNFVLINHTLAAFTKIRISLVTFGAATQVPWPIACIRTVTVCTDTSIILRHHSPFFWTGAISNGPITNDRYTSTGSFVYEPKVPNKVLSPEAVPPNLDKHRVYAWVEAR